MKQVMLQMAFVIEWLKPTAVQRHLSSSSSRALIAVPLIETQKVANAVSLACMPDRRLVVVQFDLK